MTTENNAAPLTAKEADKLFRDAYSDIHKSQGKSTTGYEGSSYDDVPVVATPVIEPSTTPPVPDPVVAAPAEPATPTQSAAAPSTPETPSAPVQKTIEELVKELPGDAQQFIQKIMAERDLADQRYRTTSGRLHKTRQEFLERQREVAELRTRVAQPQPSVEAQAKIDHAKSLEEWQAVIQAEPTLAKAVDALTDAKVGAVAAQLTKLQTDLEARSNATNEYNQALNREQEWDKLTQRVSNVQDVLSSPVYKDWIAHRAPPYIQKMATESVDHRDALFVLETYMPYAQAVQEEMNRRTNPAAPSTPAATPAAPTTPTRADEIANQRNNKPVVAVVSGAPPLNVTAQRGDLGSAEAVDDYFAQAYAKVKKR